MKRIYLGAVAALIVAGGIVACTDATAPVETGYSTTVELRVLNRTTGQLELVAPTALNVKGLALSTAAPQSLPAFSVSNTSPLLSKGFVSSSVDYKDAHGVPNHVKEFWCRTGGPVCSHYHTANGKLLSATAFTWTPVAGGFLNTRATTTFYAPSGSAIGSNTVVGTYTVATKPCNYHGPTPCPPAQMVQNRVRHAFGSAVLRLAMVTSSPALAQFGMHFLDCPLEWAAYLGAALSLEGAAAAPPPLDGAAAGGAYVTMGIALWYLEKCMLKGDTGPSPLFPGGGGGGGSNGLAGSQEDDCSSGGAGCLVLYTE